ncbi:MAG: phosphatase PAP2 family protein [Ginsengibacter sp.]
MTLPSLYKENRLFFIGFILFTIVSVLILVFYSKADGFFLLNPYHSKYSDIFFIYFTYFGDGFFCIASGVLLFIFKKRFLALMVFSGYAVSGIITQVLKYFIIEARPAVYLQSSSYQYFVDEVTLHNYHGFPSGHAASAFALAAVLSFAVKNKNYSILFLLAAISVGYSRIYLAQHFLDDVLAGAIIGLLSAIFCWMFFEIRFYRLVQSKMKSIQHN